MIEAWIKQLYDAMLMTEVSDRIAATMPLQTGLDTFRLCAKCTHNGEGKLVFVGNGGAASAASHLAVDFCLHDIRAIALNDMAAITSHANDFGVDQIFSKQLETLTTHSPDMLVAMSCSGESPNVLAAINYARTNGMGVVTLTGFAADNPMRELGDLNFYTPSKEYGFVQMAHLGLMHAVIDIEAGWRP